MIDDVTLFLNKTTAHQFWEWLDDYTRFKAVRTITFSDNFGPGYLDLSQSLDSVGPATRNLGGVLIRPEGDSMRVMHDPWTCFSFVCMETGERLRVEIGRPAHAEETKPYLDNLIMAIQQTWPDTQPTEWAGTRAWGPLTHSPAAGRQYQPDEPDTETVERMRDMLARIRKDSVYRLTVPQAIAAFEQGLCYVEPPHYEVKPGGTETRWLDIYKDGMHRGRYMFTPKPGGTECRVNWFGESEPERIMLMALMDFHAKQLEAEIETAANKLPAAENVAPAAPDVFTKAEDERRRAIVAKANKLYRTMDTPTWTKVAGSDEVDTPERTLRKWRKDSRYW